MSDEETAESRFSREPSSRQSLPFTIDAPPRDEADLVDVVERDRALLLRRLSDCGAVLLRGFRGDGIGTLAKAAEMLGGPLMAYQDRAAHRTRLEGRVYTSADYPPQHEIFLHNESTYASAWPRKLFLYCGHPAEAGGETPLADVRRVLARIRPETRRAFAARGVEYVRNFGTGIFGPSWQSAYQTEDREEMAAYCRASDISVEWLGPDRVRTRQTRPAILRHPETGELVWFNHAAALHVSTLPKRVHKRIQKLFKEEDFPTNSYYGDGSPIEPDVLDEIRQAYLQEAAPVEWQRGDVLLLDNLLVAHGRSPFRGRREVAVAMSQPMAWSEVNPVATDDVD